MQTVPIDVSGTLASRFWSKVEVGSYRECWPWKGGTGGNGYGKVGGGGHDGPALWAHRVAYALVKGPIPAASVIDHLCRNAICVNPLHLEAVSQRDNVRRGEVYRTQCKRGHELPDAVWDGRRWRRRCKVCRIARDEGRKR